MNTRKSCNIEHSINCVKELNRHQQNLFGLIQTMFVSIPATFDNIMFQICIIYLFICWMGAPLSLRKPLAWLGIQFDLICSPWNWLELLPVNNEKVIASIRSWQLAVTIQYSLSTTACSSVDNLSSMRFW